MKLAVLGFVLVWHCCWFLLTTTVPKAAGQNQAAELDKKWEIYKNTHGKKYGALTEPARRKRWNLAEKKIQENNLQVAAGKLTYRLRHSRFSDYEKKELKQLTGLVLPSSAELELLESQATFFVPKFKQTNPIPATIDLRQSKCMPPIKNQGSCGGCWAFSATNPLEYQRCLATGTMQTLSEQQLIDCTYNSVYKNQGCSGGWYMWAWDYLKTNGLVPSTIYPYTTTDGNTCLYNSTLALAGVKNYTIIAKNETIMQQALASVGPISVAICADCTSFYLYGGGVYNDQTCSGSCTVDHAVVLVGYGTVNNGTIPVWVVRNSWGTDWGIKGYALIQRNKNQNQVTYMPAYPTINMKSSWP